MSPCLPAVRVLIQTKTTSNVTQHQATQELAQQRIETLTAKLAEERDRRLLCERQRKLEREGLAWDIQQLKLSLRQWESRRRAHWSMSDDAPVHDQRLSDVAATAAMDPDQLLQVRASKPTTMLTLSLPVKDYSRSLGRYRVCVLCNARPILPLPHWCQNCIRPPCRW